MVKTHFAFHWKFLAHLGQSPFKSVWFLIPSWTFEQKNLSRFLIAAQKLSSPEQNILFDSGKLRRSPLQWNVFDFSASVSVCLDGVGNGVLGERPLQPWPPLQGHGKDTLGFLSKAVQGLWVSGLAQHLVNLPHDGCGRVIRRKRSSILEIKDYEFWWDLDMADISKATRIFWDMLFDCCRPNDGVINWCFIPTGTPVVPLKPTSPLIVQIAV